MYRSIRGQGRYPNEGGYSWNIIKIKKGEGGNTIAE